MSCRSHSSNASTTITSLKACGKKFRILDRGWRVSFSNSSFRLFSELYDTEKGFFLIHPQIAALWNWVLCLTVAVLMLGYGTCVVGANIEFSGGMKRYFFVIALLASLVLSTLFSWLIWVLGGAMRDVTTSFINFSALSLVVLQVRDPGWIELLSMLMLTAFRTQVAQTHLIAQQQGAV